MVLQEGGEYSTRKFGPFGTTGVGSAEPALAGAAGADGPAEATLPPGLLARCSRSKDVGPKGARITEVPITAPATRLAIAT